MASSIFLASPILLVILFHLLLETGPTSCFATNPTEKPPPDLRLTLTRVNLAKSFPKNQFTPSSMSETNAAEITSPTQASNDLYVTKLAIGTPPVIFSAVVDTGSDLIWTKCDSSSRFYDSSKSKSFYKSEESCVGFGCIQEYADGESIKVSMGGEKLIIGGVSSNITFACGTPNDKKSFNKNNGVVGMGRGKLSLVSQLNINVFSYCLASRSHKSEQSILLTGSNTKIAMTNVQSTPLLKQGNKSYYYIALEGISVGKTKLGVSTSDFAIKTDGTGGMIIDSGSTFTYLEKDIINMIENELMKQTKVNMSKDENPPYEGLNRYFNSPSDVNWDIPKLVFHFSGANWEMRRENYIYEKNGKSYLAFIDNDNDPEKMSIFGNMQQQNMMVLYDLVKNSLSFKPEICSRL